MEFLGSNECESDAFTHFEPILNNPSFNNAFKSWGGGGGGRGRGDLMLPLPKQEKIKPLLSISVFDIKVVQKTFLVYCFD